MKMGEKEIHVSGNRLNSWESCSVDINVTGLDWFVVGLNGEALLALQIHNPGCYLDR